MGGIFSAFLFWICLFGSSPAAEIVSLIPRDLVFAGCGKSLVLSYKSLSASQFTTFLSESNRSLLLSFSPWSKYFRDSFAVAQIREGGLLIADTGAKSIVLKGYLRFISSGWAQGKGRLKPIRYGADLLFYEFEDSQGSRYCFALSGTFILFSQERKALMAALDASGDITISAAGEQTNHAAEILSAQKAGNILLIFPSPLLPATADGNLKTQLNCGSFSWDDSNLSLYFPSSDDIYEWGRRRIDELESSRTIRRERLSENMSRLSIDLADILQPEQPREKPGSMSVMMQKLRETVLFCNDSRGKLYLSNSRALLRELEISPAVEPLVCLLDPAQLVFFAQLAPLFFPDFPINSVLSWLDRIRTIRISAQASEVQGLAEVSTAIKFK